MNRLASFALVSVFVACASSATQRQVSDPTPTDAGATVSDARVVFKDAGPSGGTCARDIKTQTVKVSDQSCYINTKVQNTTGSLEYPCTGGAATIDLGGQVFEGYVTNDTIDLTNVEDFVFQGCNWQSTQKLKGDLTTGSVKYTYSETPLQACSGQFACTANGTMSVTAGAQHPIN